MRLCGDFWQNPKGKKPAHDDQDVGFQTFKVNKLPLRELHTSLRFFVGAVDRAEAPHLGEEQQSDLWSV